jgi:glycosyltransferase involved in cell wall biosynthesis
MKIAVVHDYFTQLGGAEKVAEELVRILPGSTLHSTVALTACMPSGLIGMPVKTSWMQYLPLMHHCYRLYFLLYPFAVNSLDFSECDLVVSSSSGFAKGVRAGRDAVHVCYCHTPMRWVWNFESYVEREEMGLATRLILPYLIKGLRKWDLAASRQPDYFVANSRSVAERIQRAYGRVAEVIHPPIDLDRFHACSEQEDYYLVLSRLVSYKRIDLAVEACNLLKRQLIVIGDGPDRARLAGKAGPTVRFLGRLPDAEVEHYASRCRALIFPGEEDFGMAPLELAAAGRPTIAYRAGGAVETIVEGVTGTFFDRQDPGELVKAIKCFEQMDWHPDLLRNHAEGFGIDVFRASFYAFLARIGCPIHDQAPLSSPLASVTAVSSPALRAAQNSAPA